MKSNEAVYKLFASLKETESRSYGDFGLDESDQTLYWQYKRDFDDEEDLGDILSDVKTDISPLLSQFNFEVTDEYIESSFASFQIKPKE